MPENRVVKKILLFFVLIFLAGSVFANIEFCQTVSGVGLGIESVHYYDYYKQNCEFLPFTGLDISVLWEFNSSDMKAVHYSTGFSFGIGLGFNYAIPFHVNYCFFSKDKIRLEYQTKFLIGIMQAPLIGYIYPYLNISPCVILMKENRKGLYLATGLKFETASWFYIREGYGLQEDITALISLELGIGLKF